MKIKIKNLRKKELYKALLFKLQYRDDLIKLTKEYERSRDSFNNSLQNFSREELTESQQKFFYKLMVNNDDCCSTYQKIQYLLNKT